MDEAAQPARAASLTARARRSWANVTLRHRFVQPGAVEG
jgi:hypothetical protein